MDLGITGKVAMVAAGSKGIGLATAKLLSEEGCRLSICSRSEENLEIASHEIPGECQTYVVNLESSEDIEWWINSTNADLGVPEILITNTGGPPAGNLDTLTDEQWQSGISSTLMNVVRLCRGVVPGMKEVGWGRIVHVTSFVAKQPSQLLPISSTLRAGLRALTRNQATEYGEYGINVNSVLPGHTLTERQTHLAQIRSEREGLTPDEILESVANEIPLKRLAEAKEIAQAIAFLCSNPASYVTGVNLTVDGGLTRTVD